MCEVVAGKSGSGSFCPQIMITIMMLLLIILIINITLILLILGPALRGDGSGFLLTENVMCIYTCLSLSIYIYI